METPNKAGTTMVGLLVTWNIRHRLMPDGNESWINRKAS